MYEYSKLKEKVFTERGQEMFLEIRDNTKSLLKSSGAVRMQEAIKGTSGDSWLMLACVDRMVELEELKELTSDDVIGQNRVFVRGEK